MSRSDQPRRLVTIAEAAKYSAISPSTIRRRIADGTVTGYRIGPRLLRVDLNDLDDALHVVRAGGAHAA